MTTLAIAPQVDATFVKERLLATIREIKREMDADLGALQFLDNVKGFMAAYVSPI
jgi:hypothetical protein